jgi:hypothetical protein
MTSGYFPISFQWLTEKYVLDKSRSNLRFRIEDPGGKHMDGIICDIVNTKTGKEYYC